MMLDIDFIKKLSKVIEDNELSEIEISDEKSSIRIVKQERSGYINATDRENGNIAIANTIPPNISQDATPPSQNAENDTQKQSGNIEIDYKNHPGALKSPMVGIFYKSPEPGAKPFVSEGDFVNEGDALFIIEAMKTMNQIKAQKNGKVLKILAQDGNPVEFGEALVVIE